MSCIYSDWEGNCTMWSENEPIVGCSNKGICEVDGDPDPSVVFEPVDPDEYENS